MNKKILIFVLPFLIFVGLVLMLAGRLGKPSDITNHTATGKILPDYALPLLSDPNRTMTKNDLPKTPFILNVWGSWCPTCRVEHPFLMELSKAGVPMVGVNYKDERSEALAYLNEHHDPFVYSVQDYEGDLALDLGLTGAPESFVVDETGRIWQHIAGELHQQNYQAQVAPCLDALKQKNEQAIKAKCGA